MIVLDSSAWLEFFVDGPHARKIAPRMRDLSIVATSSIALYEVYKWLKRERSEEDALLAVAAMKQTRIVDVTDEIALTAADLSLSLRLPMADSVMLATARAQNAELVTTDSDFEGIPGVILLSKKS